MQESSSADPARLVERFAQAHEARYGYRDDAAEVELVTIRVSAWRPAPPLRLSAARPAAPRAGRGGVVFAGERVEAAILRGALPPGTRLQGPALCALPDSSLLIPPGWRGEVSEHGTSRLERAP